MSVSRFARPFPFLLLASVLVLSGCLSTPKLRNVSVSLVDVKSAQPALLETQIVATVRYANENVVPIGVTGSRHNLYLNNTYIGKALSNAPVGLRDLSTNTQEITFIVSNVKVLNELRALADRPQASYRLESVLFVDVGEERLEIRDRGEGMVDLQNLRLQ